MTSNTKLTPIEAAEEAYQLFNLCDCLVSQKGLIAAITAFLEAIDVEQVARAIHDSKESGSSYEKVKSKTHLFAAAQAALQSIKQQTQGEK